MRASVCRIHRELAAARRRGGRRARAPFFGLRRARLRADTRQLTAAVTQRACADARPGARGRARAPVALGTSDAFCCPFQRTGTHQWYDSSAAGSCQWRGGSGCITTASSQRQLEGWARCNLPQHYQRRQGAAGALRRLVRRSRPAAVHLHGRCSMRCVRIPAWLPCPLP